MPLPKSIRIVGHTYTVQVEPSEHFNSQYMGQINHQELTIRVGTHIPPEQQRETLLHEVIHGVDVAMRLNLSEEDTSRLSRGLHAALRDNPDFAKYLTE